MSIVIGAVSILNSSLFKDPNLTNYWAMDGSSGATTGSTSGTDTSISYETETPFLSGSSAYLNARTDRIAFGAILNTPRGNNGTIHAWVHPTANGINGDADYKFTSWFSKGDIYYRLGHRADNTIRAYYYSGGAVPTYFTSTGAITINSWNMVDYTWSNGEANIYINGVLDSTSANSFYAGNSGGDAGDVVLGLGPEVGANTYGYIGYVDDYAFFNRKLTATEIAALYFSSKQKMQMIL